MDDFHERMAKIVALASQRAEAFKRQGERLENPTATDEEIVDASARFGLAWRAIDELCTKDGADTVGEMREGPDKEEARRLIRVEVSYSLVIPSHPRPDLVQQIKERQRALEESGWQP